jgi:hypothetical protein
MVSSQKKKDSQVPLSNPPASPGIASAINTGRYSQIQFARFLGELLPPSCKPVVVAASYYLACLLFIGIPRSSEAGIRRARPFSSARLQPVAVMASSWQWHHGTLLFIGPTVEAWSWTGGFFPASRSLSFGRPQTGTGLSEKGEAGGRIFLSSVCSG